MAAERTVHYADSGGLQIAYEVLGDGPIDIVFAGESGTNLDLNHGHPRWGHFVNRLGEFGRLICLDLRGVGLSDPIERVPTLEEWVADIRAVMADAGSRRAALVGHGASGQIFLLFAAMYPNQTTALVTINAFARLRRAPDYPWGYPPAAADSVLNLMANRWGTGTILGAFNPGMVDSPQGREWLARLERAASTPRRAVRLQQIVFDLDVRDILSGIDAPTLVVHSSDDSYVLPAHSAYLIDHIAGATSLEVPGFDHTPYLSSAQGVLIEAIEQFLTGSTHRATADRAIRTIAFTDIVDSTKRAAEMGDRRWRDLLEMHESISRREIAAAEGRLVKLTGDGLMATFDGPARAVQCVHAIGDLLDPMGLPIRAGVHTGEVELLGDDIGGIAVHIAARIAAKASAGEVLVSSTVRDLVAGSGLEFDDRGEHELKGVPGTWRVLAVR